MPRQVATGRMPDLTGCTIDNGRYLLDKLLGSGAYGKVYRAVDLRSPSGDPKHYAIKCMPIHNRGSTKAEFQRRELSLHPMVRGHPNIVRFERSFRDRDWIYLVMELVEGGDLFAAITEKKIFQNNDALVKKIYLQIIDAVQFCHSKGIFHRDIKPENILCSSDGQHIKLADFGLSTRSTASAEYGCGSCYYMSPGEHYHPLVHYILKPCSECIGQRNPPGLMYSSKRTDVWSMGIILVNMISGRNPWRYATQDDQCYFAYLQDQDFLMNALSISLEANGIIKRIFSPDPFQRITLEELREEIVRVRSFFRISLPLEHNGFTNARIIHCNQSVQSGPCHSSSVSILLHEAPLSSRQVDTGDNFSLPRSQPTGPGAFLHGSGFKPPDGESSSVPSSKSSLAVKTPSVHAVDAAVVARPGAARDEDVDESLALPGSVLDKALRSPGSKSKLINIQKSRDILRAAVRRIKDFPGPPKAGSS